MHRTIFSTPVIKPALRWFSRTLLNLRGWELDFSATEHVERCVIIGAPHTSNWDLPCALLLAFSQDMPIYWMGKIQIFRFPFKRLMMWLGGVPIDRSRSLNVVSQAIGQLQNTDNLYLVIAPEGTRSKVEQWKTGFYHIADGAGVPILPAYIDHKARRAGIYKAYKTSGDVEADVAEIQELYGDLLKRHKGNQG